VSYWDAAVQILLLLLCAPQLHPKRTWRCAENHHRGIKFQETIQRRGSQVPLLDIVTEKRFSLEQALRLPVVFDALGPVM